MKIALAGLLVFSFASGIIIGLAYERYLHREACLKVAFENNPSELTPSEINEITDELNAEGDKEESNGQTAPTDIPATSNDNSTNQPFVGSRNSNKFYPATCSYSKRIKAENKVYFASVEEGTNAGRQYVDCN